VPCPWPRGGSAWGEREGRCLPSTTPINIPVQQTTSGHHDKNHGVFSAQRGHCCPTTKHPDNGFFQSGRACPLQKKKKKKTRPGPGSPSPLCRSIHSHSLLHLLFGMVWGQPFPLATNALEILRLIIFPSPLSRTPSGQPARVRGRPNGATFAVRRADQFIPNWPSPRLFFAFLRPVPLPDLENHGRVAFPFEVMKSRGQPRFTMTPEVTESPMGMTRVTSPGVRADPQPRMTTI